MPRPGGIGNLLRAAGRLDADSARVTRSTSGPAPAGDADASPPHANDAREDDMEVDDGAHNHGGDARAMSEDDENSGEDARAMSEDDENSGEEDLSDEEESSDEDDDSEEDEEEELDDAADGDDRYWKDMPEEVEDLQFEVARLRRELESAIKRANAKGARCDHRCHKQRGVVGPQTLEQKRKAEHRREERATLQLRRDMQKRGLCRVGVINRLGLGLSKEDRKLLRERGFLQQEWFLAVRDVVHRLQTLAYTAENSLEIRLRENISIRAFRRMRRVISARVLLARELLCRLLRQVRHQRRGVLDAELLHRLTLSLSGLARERNHGNPRLLLLPRLHLGQHLLLLELLDYVRRDFVLPRVVGGAPALPLDKELALASAEPLLQDALDLPGPVGAASFAALIYLEVALELDLLRRLAHTQRLLLRREFLVMRPAEPDVADGHGDAVAASGLGDDLGVVPKPFRVARLHQVADGDRSGAENVVSHINRAQAHPGPLLSLEHPRG